MGGPTTGRTAVALVWEAGPAAGTTTTIGRGRHVVGRSRAAAVVVADRAVELHHLLLDVDDDGGVRAVQLTGRVPCRVDGVPLGAGGAPVPGGAVVSVGASRLRVGERPPSAEASPPPSILDEPLVLPVAIDDRRGRALAMAPLVLAVLAAVGAARGSRVALAAAIFMAAVGLGARRRSRARSGRVAAAQTGALTRFERDLARRRTAWITARRAEAPDLAALVADPGPGWSGASSFRVALGLGPDRWRSGVEPDGRADPVALALVAAAEQPLDVPVTADLGPGRVVTLSGPGAASVARAAVVQLAATVGPDRLRVGFRTSDGDRPPAWAAALPHVAPVAVGDGHHEVVVVDRPDVVERPPAELRASLLVARSAALVVVDEAARTAVSPGGGRLDLGVVGRSRWRTEPGQVAAEDVHAAGLDESAATAVAATLAAREVVPAPPSSAMFARLLAAAGRPRADDTIGVAAAWATGSGPPSALIGMAGDGVVAVDVAPGVRLAVVGDDGEAVDRVVTNVVTTLAAAAGPDELAIVDLARSELPHATGRGPCPVALFVVDDRAGAVVDHAGPDAAVLLVAGSDAGPMVRRALTDPATTTVALTIADEALARLVAGDDRPCRLGPAAAIVRRPDGSTRLVRLPGPGDAGPGELGGAVRRAAALTCRPPGAGRAR